MLLMLNKIVLFFKTKWIFDSIKNTNFLIIGHDNSNLIIKILSLASVEVVSFKILNLNIIFKLLLSGKKINKLNYFIKSIQLINPKIVLTTIDNDIDFYRLKNFFPNKKFVSIQNGYRTENKKAFLIKKGEKLQCDLIFCWGKQNIKYYKSIIKAKIVPIGSLKNNLLPLKKIKKKRLLLIFQNFAQ